MDFEVKKGGSIEGEKLSEEEMGIRKGSWSVEEDTILINYIATHGEGSWNSIARCAGLKRSGKSCRLRWLNYLRPDVRRGNITLQEQIMILDLHSRWGNRWSKIAKHLPGRTDNEIKNYWRTRVIKQAKQLKCDVNSKQFRDALRYDWMPRLLERIQPPSETYCPTHISPLQLDPNPSASAARVHVHHQHGLHLHRSSLGTKWVNQIYSSCGSGPCSDSTSVDLLVHSDSGQSVSPEQLGQNVSVHSIGNDNVPGLCPSFNNQMFEQRTTILPFDGGGGGDSLDGLWNDESIWLLGQLCDDLEIKNNFLA